MIAQISKTNSMLSSPEALFLTVTLQTMISMTEFLIFNIATALNELSLNGLQLLYLCVFKFIKFAVYKAKFKPQIIFLF